MKILRFGAVWCVTCLAMRPIWEEIEKNYPQIKIEYYDIDDDNALFKLYNFKDVPATVLIKNNNEEVKLEGYREKKEIIKIIEEVKI
jgi:thiol-disulfide isomerase/thioredoxin